MPWTCEKPWAQSLALNLTTSPLSLYLRLRTQVHPIGERPFGRVVTSKVPASIKLFISSAMASRHLGQSAVSLAAWMFLGSTDLFEVIIWWAKWQARRLTISSGSPFVSIIKARLFRDGFGLRDLPWYEIWDVSSCHLGPSSPLCWRFLVLLSLVGTSTAFGAEAKFVEVVSRSGSGTVGGEIGLSSSLPVKSELFGWLMNSKRVSSKKSDSSVRSSCSWTFMSGWDGFGLASADGSRNTTSRLTITSRLVRSQSK